MKFKKLLFLFFLLNMAHLVVVSQTDDYVQSKSKKNNGWQQGYVILKYSTDTLRGYLKIKATPFGSVHEVWFRKDKEIKKGTLKIPTPMPLSGFPIYQDTLRFFGIGSKKYIYLDYIDSSIPTRYFQTNNSFTGWAEIIEEGPIDIYKGVSLSTNYHSGQMISTGGGGTMMVGGGSSIYYTPIYYLKNGRGSTVIIEAVPISIFKEKDFMYYEVDERNKNHFFKYISDEPNILEKIKNYKLLFIDIEKYVKKYNQSHRN